MIKFLQIRDVPTQIPGHPGHSLSKTTEKGHLHKVLSGISRRLGPGCPRNIPPKNFIKKRLLQKSEGNFSNKVPGEFSVFFWGGGGFFRAFFLRKNRRKKSTKKSTAKLKSDFGSFAAKIHTARIRPKNFVFRLFFLDLIFGGFPCRFPKKQGKEDQGMVQTTGFPKQRVWK